MATIKAFKALRPAPEKAAAVAALPYDVYNRAEARAAARGRCDSFLRVDRPETTMDERIDLYDPAVYRKAKINLERLISRQVLIQDETPCLYLYELTMNGRSQTGIVACTAVDEYLNGTIKKHELTRADKEQDRIRHVDACNANTGPIFLTYRHQKAIAALTDQVKKMEAAVDFVADDGVRHRVWIIDDAAAIDALIDQFAAVPALYIADGHHRAASAVKVAQMRREAHPGYTGEEPFNFFLSVIFPDSDLSIMDYNRVVKDLNGLSEAEFLAAIERDFNIKRLGEKAAAPDAKATFTMLLESTWYRLRAKAGTYDSEDPVKSLDVSILQENLLAPILGIGDPRTDARIDFVGGIRGLAELKRRVATDMHVAFALYPTSIAELMAIADAGMLMPPKSTWFEPKLRSGLFIHKLS
ncbi:DUF1015 domain-containing protein [Pseudoramibacter faecis]|uniref:DUF1015 domain-containing protein n=1 Tax=Pseudoramibacter faecis TaxID=3108534 RepID=UPI002E7621E4|nr:DUF1015 family protein [Pseudoramibacter sp. HA2172]